MLDSKKFPLVSVIIPNYNHELFLERRIQSVIEQTYETLEIIILDDASTDDSRNIILKFQSHPKVVKIEFNSKNTGSPFTQWQKGITYSSGEYIWIAESDDFADPNFLEVMVTLLEKNSELGLSYCDSYFVYSNDTLDGTFASKKNLKLNTDRWGNDYRNSGVAEIKNYLLPHGTINNTSAVLFRRDALVEFGSVDNGFLYTGDKFVFIRILSKWDLAYIAKPYNYYRASENSLPKHTTDFIDYTFEAFRIFDWVHRNMQIDSKSFRDAFYLNTSNSLVRGWNLKKIGIYLKFLKINRYLFFLFLVNNLKRTLGKIIFPNS